MAFLNKLLHNLATINNSYHRKTPKLSDLERAKTPKRYDIINLLLKNLDRPSTYLEIGVRNPAENFDMVNAETKYSVDPGVEYKKNPVDFKLTSDEFFDGMRKGEILEGTKFDVIFVDGLHLADQVERDIDNSLEFLKEDGFLILHDCNPPSEWHARERYDYIYSPALKSWNGTTWKAFVKATQRQDLTSCCIDTDWGVGILTRQNALKAPTKIDNPYYEFSIFNDNRKESLNLISYDEFKKMLG